MTIIYNNQSLQLPDKDITVADLANMKDVPKQGAAIAVNDKLIKRDLWNSTKLNSMDQITVIVSAYGG